MQHNSLNTDPAVKGGVNVKEPAAQATQESRITEALSVVCDELGSSHDLGVIGTAE